MDIPVFRSILTWLDLLAVPADFDWLSVVPVVEDVLRLGECKLLPGDPLNVKDASQLAST